MPTNNLVCVIPARGGSKGIPGKNLIELGGQPLLAWTINAAIQSGVFDRIIVSTDSQKIATVAREFGAEVPFLRPENLAADNVHAVHVVLHALDWLQSQGGALPDGVMMLLPTSPLRKPEDIQAATTLFSNQQAASVVSVVDLGKRLTNLRHLHGNKLTMAVSGQSPNAQRQGDERLYGVNGSIFLARPEILRRYGTYHVEGALGHVMDQLHSVDIDEPADLELARRLIAFSASSTEGITCLEKT